MLIAAFAFDYDGTLAKDGRVESATTDALQRLKSSGVKLLLVTGRELPDLQQVYPQHELFDLIVAENGALLYWPARHEQRVLGPAPPPRLVRALQIGGIQPLSIGRSIIATCRPNESKLLEAIRESKVEWQIVFNKDAVMALPSGINKASGLAAALAALEISPLNVFGVGDAENDHALLQACGYRAAVANAVDTLKQEVDLVTRADHGAGIIELIERFLRDPAEGLSATVRRHDIALGQAEASGAAQRKYAQGNLGEDKSFYFRGSAGALNLRAQNLTLFLQIADGIDDDTWLYHLRRHDYSRWFREAIKDEELASAAGELENRLPGDPAESRRAMRELITRRYTAPAN